MTISRRNNRLRDLIRAAALICLSLSGPIKVSASSLVETVVALEHAELMAAYSDKQVDALLNGYGQKLNDEDRRAAAVLIANGVIDPADLERAESIDDHLANYRRVVEQNHPDLLGRIGDAALQLRLNQSQQYELLLDNPAFLEVLGEKLTEGVITGYDLRRKKVYDALPVENTFVYSHSSLKHLKQLVTVAASEGIDAWFYVTPKVSAFLFREEWGPAGDNVVELESGVKVVQGREMAVAFQFDDPNDRYRFDRLIAEFAKKDDESEQGLIADAWWQPFYYTQTPLDGFKPISLIVLSDDHVEATLTVVEERTAEVEAAFRDSPFEMRRDRVWVNPPFFRFLNGDYR